MALPEKIAKLMGIMSANYPNYKLTEQAIVLYTRILDDIPEDALEAAAMDLCSRNDPFYPTSGQWRQRALDIMLSKAGLPLAIEAWEEAYHEVGRCGDYWRYPDNPKMPKYSHYLIEKTVAAVGYKSILEPDNVEVLRAQFLKAYEALKGRLEDDLRTLPAVKNVERAYLESANNQPKLGG